MQCWCATSTHTNMPPLQQRAQEVAAKNTTAYTWSLVFQANTDIDI